MSIEQPPKDAVSSDLDAQTSKQDDGQVDALQSATQPQPGSRSYNEMNFPFDENLFYSAPLAPPTTALPADDAEDEQAAAALETPHPPDFKPFFTLVEDPANSDHQHPTVHYLFSDDDPDILTSAVLDTLEAGGGSNDNSPNLRDSSERYVIVDVAADGKSVVSAASLSADWQAVRAELAPAPSFGEEASGGARGLMLKVSGQEREMKRRGQVQNAEDLDELIRSFNEQLEKLEQAAGKE
ncbi:hypothetical protein BDY17DRAFT_295101 [Neohortaea acidophila]|uniref:Uncharacterized protein n=1 Tax=Neohortaea acidophila TaxID=245834 RepID=A0A6A6PVJ0_9PEZI|nr:uncharacterized protein BDY17DRAFT_295101 [Neohortaea acidophila]KAF2484150.1 hypothetical protein BDY17DRAFT_295101 [Neohortaea acidophila]